MRIPSSLNRIKELQSLGSLEEYCSKLMNNVRTTILPLPPFAPSPSPLCPPPPEEMLRWFFEEVVFLGSDFFSSELLVPFCPGVRKVSLHFCTSTYFSHAHRMPQNAYISLTCIYKASLYQNIPSEVIVTGYRPLRNDPALSNERRDISTLHYYQLES